MSLFPNLRPASAPDGIDIRLCDVGTLCKEVRGARLVCADPPWSYSEGAAGKGMAQPELNGIYSVIADTEIAAHLDAAFDVAGPSARLACWYTWPKAAEWIAAGMAGPRWGQMVTGGAWTKQMVTSSGARRMQVGVGYHWRGQSEPVAVFTKGATGRPTAMLLNAHVSPPGPHSEKPVAWLREWVRAWTDPGDLVVDLYSGLAPLARACLREGRRYIGAELSESRRDESLAALARYRAEEGL